MIGSTEPLSFRHVYTNIAPTMDICKQLSKRNVPMYIIRILICWYTSQTMYARWNNTLSTGFNVSNGVRQGGILSPYIFWIYVDELCKMLNNVHVGCFVGTMLVNHLMYADDLVLLSPSAAGLSILLSIYSTYVIEYNVMYNSTKSNVLVFRSKLLKNVHVPEFEINNTAIDRVGLSMYKYLGHCINDELSDDDDMTRQRNKIYAHGNALIRKFYMCTENVKIALFKSYCTTIYTSTLWCKYRRESLQKLCVAYNNIFRKFTHQAWDCRASQMFVWRQLPTCKMLIRRNVYGFMLNEQKSNNLILNSIVHCDILFTSPLWKHWRLLLYIHPF